MIAASVVLAVLLIYVVVGAYMPSRQHAAGLEAEIQEVYRKEADLQAQLDRALKQTDILNKQVTALTSERDALTLRLRELEQAILKTTRKP